MNDDLENLKACARRVHRAQARRMAVSGDPPRPGFVDRVLRAREKEDRLANMMWVAEWGLAVATTTVIVLYFALMPRVASVDRAAAAWGEIPDTKSITWGGL